MSKHNETGVKGELFAVNFLQGKGYEILERNWRHGHKEIDIIAKKDNVLFFIEIKTRSGLTFGFPEEAVTAKKQAHLKIAAEAFAEKRDDYKHIQFDIISIVLDGESVKEIMHFEDAFY